MSVFKSKIIIKFSLFCWLGLWASGTHAQFDGPLPWPEICKQRIKTLLPVALKKANVDAWLVICRENNNDPLADHVGCENAGKTAAFLFYNEGDSFTSLAYSPVGEATALADVGVVEKVFPVARIASSLQMVANFIQDKDFAAIAVNMSESNAQADGFSFTQYQALAKALGPEFTKRLVSSDEVVYQ